MNQQKISTALRLAAMCVLAVLLTACAAAPASQPQSLAERAQARWDALLAQDFEKAYQFLTPGTRSSISMIDYTVAFRLRRVQYNSARYLDEECLDNACTVRMNMGYTLHNALRGVPEFKGKSTIKEKWVRVDGNWWFLPEN